MFMSDSRLPEYRASSSGPHILHQNFKASGRNELAAVPQSKSLFWLQDRAVAEAFCLALEMQGQMAVSLHSISTEERNRHIHSVYALLLVDPGCCLADPELMELVRSKGLRVVFMASEVKAAHIDLALKCKARGFVSTQCPLSHVITRISQLLTGELEEYWCPEAEEFIEFRGKHKKMRAKSVFSLLTPRQLEVLTFLAEGKSVKEVAQVMHLSQKSIDSHKYRIMNRLHVHDRVHLARIAIREGLIEP